jgi:ABC-2 type transport system permease protein
VSNESNKQFQMVQGRGWTRGLGNLVRGEFSNWFKSSRWWKQLIIWFLIVDAMMGTMVYASDRAAQDGQEGPPLLLMYGLFGGMFVAFGVMIIMQRVIIGEKRSGTAAWVLSKPVTRTAFVVSRLVVNSIAILLTSVVVPGVIVYLTLGLWSDLGWLSPLSFLGGMAMVALHTLFWIVLVLMMGTLFERSGGVIAVPLVLYFVLWMSPGMIPELSYVSPLLLAFSPGPEQVDSLAASVMTGEPVFSWLPVISTMVLCAISVGVAVWRFNRQQF